MQKENDIKYHVMNMVYSLEPLSLIVSRRRIIKVIIRDGVKVVYGEDKHADVCMQAGPNTQGYQKK